MSHIEGQPGIKIEGLGGSFARNVRLGEDGLGMRYTAGDTFRLNDVWHESEGGPVYEGLEEYRHRAGTILAPGSFEAIFLRRKDGEIIRFDSQGDIFGMRADGDQTKYWLDAFLTENSEIQVGEEFEEVVLKKWGHFTNFDGYVSKNPNVLTEVPESTIEQEFNDRFDAAHLPL